MFIETFGKPTVGILPLQHENYESQNFSIQYRASKHCVRITGRQDTGQGIGQWTYDKDSQGDLIGGNCWLANYQGRPMSAWSWAWPAMLSAGGGGRSSRSTQTAETTANTGRPQGVSTSFVGDYQAVPLGKGGAPDVKRFIPKNVVVPAGFGAAGNDPNGPNENPPAGPVDPNSLILGIGGQVISVTGGSFPTFDGVRTDFSGASFPEFQGVRTNFSGGKPGANFSGVKDNFSLGRSGNRPK